MRHLSDEELRDYALERLDDDEANRAEAHLGECRECRAQLAFTEALIRAARNLKK